MQWRFNILRPISLTQFNRNTPWISNIPISQIPQCACPISHNASLRTEMWIYEIGLVYLLLSVGWNCSSIPQQEWMNNFIPHVTWHVFTYPCWNQCQTVRSRLFDRLVNLFADECFFYVTRHTGSIILFYWHGGLHYSPWCYHNIIKCELLHRHFSR